MASERGEETISSLVNGTLHASVILFSLRREFSHHASTLNFESFLSLLPAGLLLKERGVLSPSNLGDCSHLEERVNRSVLDTNTQFIVSLLVVTFSVVLTSNLILKNGKDLIVSGMVENVVLSSIDGLMSGFYLHTLSEKKILFTDEERRRLVLEEVERTRRREDPVSTFLHPTSYLLPSLVGVLLLVPLLYVRRGCERERGRMSPSMCDMKEALLGGVASCSLIGVAVACLDFSLGREQDRQNIRNNVGVLLDLLVSKEKGEERERILDAIRERVDSPLSNEQKEEKEEEEKEGRGKEAVFQTILFCVVLLLVASFIFLRNRSLLPKASVATGITILVQISFLLLVRAKHLNLSLSTFHQMVTSHSDGGRAKKMRE